MTRRHRTAIGLLVALGVAVTLVAVTIALDTGYQNSGVSEGEDSDGKLPSVVLKYPHTAGISDGSVNLLGLEDLTEQSDIVVVGEVVAQSEYTRADAGIKGLQGVLAIYSVEVEQYLKGGGSATLDVRKVVAYEDSGEALGLKDGFSYFVDDSHPLSIGARYVLALRSAGDGWFAQTAEPFRFRIEDGAAIVESTVEGVKDDPYVDEIFPTKAEADLIADVESIVAAQAAETAAR